MAILGGSPLGLIGLKSVSTNGMSGFNAGASNNVVVSDYNRSKSGNGSAYSLFSGRRRLRAWPNISASISPDTKDPADKRQDTTGLSDVYVDGGSKKLIDNYVSPIGENSKGSNLLHNNDVYDTSVLNILEKLSPTKGALKATDFAYLKYLGVYPNNRLMIARRFTSPSPDNIMVRRKDKDLPSIATLISWKPEGEDFFEIQFGEEWTAAKADFTGILNSLGDDFGKTGMGKIAGAAGNILPLPGFTEIFQRKFLESLELLESGSSGNIPAGNPNLIKEAKVRKTVPYGEAASGLTAKINIKMTCEYELKFISGIDPTIVWMDIIGMILRFGTSESGNYGLSQKVAAKLGRWAADPYKLIDDVVDGIKTAISNAQGELMDGLKDTFNKATVAAAEMANTDDKSESDAALELAKSAYDEGSKLVTKLAGVGKDIIRSSVMKYRVEMMGIVAALTGNPSTPWHITLGNPLRPIFCSGDMLVTETTLKLGPDLAFNDLPSSIVAEFTLSNARPLGLQEIMAKFNSGYLRTVDIQKTFFETTVNFDSKGNFKNNETIGGLPGETGIVQAPIPPPINEGGGGAGTGSSGSSGSSGTGSSGSSGSSGTSGIGSNDKSSTDVKVPGSLNSSGSSGTSGDQSKLVGGQK